MLVRPRGGLLGAHRGATQGTNHNLTPQNVNLIIFPWERAGLPVRTRGSLSAAYE